MKYLVSFFAFTLTFFLAYGQDSTRNWKDFQKQHQKRQEDTGAWSKELLQRDIGDSLHNKTSKPFPNGAFPVPKYELADYFRYKGGGNYVGNFPNYFGKKLIFHSFIKNKTEATRDILKEKPNEAFFIILTLTNYIDTVKGSNFAFFLSRNNPDVISEGFFKAQNQDEVAYMAFLTGNRDEFAVVNMKLFDLKNGRTILVAPQKDHSLRFLQIPTPILSDKEVKPFLDKILEQEKVRAFFLDNGSL